MNKKARGIIATVIAAAAIQSGPVLAQQLEEIIVTAQRREQSLQEVPISLEAISGVELREQGMRSLDDLANMMPTVEIDYGLQEQDVSIRGYGTETSNLTSDLAAPTFVDGIHFSRGAMIRNAFLDVERVEVLRGPQPVYFGQNATVGAFSITSRRPGPEWQGDLTGEVGNFGRLSLEGGVGGPISDTFGIRVAGKWDQTDGYMTDVVKRTKFPDQRDVAGRVILQWAPTDNFEGAFKFGVSDSDAGVNHGAVCLTEFDSPSGLSRDTLIPGVTEFNAAVDINDDCFTERGLANSTPFLAPPPDVTEDQGGIIDIRQAVTEIRGGEVGWDDIKSYDSYLDLSYRFANGIEVSSLTGYVDYFRTADHENGVSAALMINERLRTEDLTSWSQEFRVSSPVGGMFEWMVGFYWQQEDMAVISDNLVANIRRPRRYNDIWQDAETISGFAAVTFNFMDNKASIDLGGRYSEIDKEAFMQGFGSTWIFDVDPTPSTPGAGCVEGVNAVHCFRANGDVINLGNGTWTHRWNRREIGDVWNTVAPIGLTALDPLIRDDLRPGGVPHTGTISNDDFNPQVVLRYRPTENLSAYAKWSQAFKVGGFETGVSSLVDFTNSFVFKPEYSENWEIGGKGTFWDGSGRADLSLFWQEVKDLQIETTVVPPPGETQAPTPTVNAGLVRVRGAEFSVDLALSDRFAVGIAGALMDGKMVEFPNAGCTPSEAAAADTGPCISEDESEAIFGDDRAAGLIDRSGMDAPRTPTWKFVGQANYWMPLLDDYKGVLNTSLAISDGYIDDVQGFDHITDWGTHADWNVNIGFGDANDVWRITAWMRNILEARPQYNPEFDVEPTGVARKIMSSSDFRTYGLQFQYNYN
jgi:outer membrane receptor protein involved in Fe transport